MTALAAYRLSMQSYPNDTAGAINYAQKVIDETHLDYSPENAPYWMRPGVVPGAKVLFQFKKYQQGMIYLLARNTVKAFSVPVSGRLVATSPASVVAALAKRIEK
jgi:hypothetical protein